MNVFDAIELRHSVRTYRDKPVPQEDLVKLLEAAHRAPSSWNLQPWEFVVVTDPEVKKRLRAAANNQAQVEEAGAVFVCLGSMRQQDALADRIEGSIPADAAPERIERTMRTVNRMRHDPELRKMHVLNNTYIGISFLVLAAQALGLSSVWMAGFNADQVREVLSIPDDFFVVSLVAVGYTPEGYVQPPRKRRPVSEIQHWNRFGRPNP